jgi:predicted NodU family carbamoyl transferase
LFGAGEELFTRNKQQDGFPLHAIEATLKYTNIEEIDMVVYSFMKSQDEMKLINRNLENEKQFLKSFYKTNLKPRLAKASEMVPKRRLDHIHGLDLQT